MNLKVFNLSRILGTENATYPSSERVRYLLRVFFFADSCHYNMTVIDNYIYVTFYKKIETTELVEMIKHNGVVVFLDLDLEVRLTF